MCVQNLKLNLKCPCCIMVKMPQSDGVYLDRILFGAYEGRNVPDLMQRQFLVRIPTPADCCCVFWLDASPNVCENVVCE